MFLHNKPILTLIYFSSPVYALPNYSNKENICIVRECTLFYKCHFGEIFVKIV